MNETELIELLGKYLNGLCTGEEVQLVREWYRSFENDPDYFDGLDAAAERELEKRIYDNIISKTGINKVVPIGQANNRRQRYWYAAAAVIAVLITAGVWIFRGGEKDSNILSAALSRPSVINLTNNSAEIEKIKLPDNSSVWLNPHSQISYPSAFKKHYRLVSMAGECFFEVTKNPARPFIVRSRSIITKVWGTSFRVNDDAASDSAEVSVLTGKVSVSIRSKSALSNTALTLAKTDVMLYPNQSAVYSVDKHQLRQEKNNAPQPSMREWTRVSLLFASKPLSDIVPVLNTRYNAHIAVEDPKLRHYILNADFESFNLPEVLEALKKSLNITYEIKGDSIMLK